MQKVAESKPKQANVTGGVGARIRRRRLDLGLTQRELARRLGISAAYLNLIEHDRRRIGGRLLNDAARALDIPSARLAQGAAGALVDDLRAAAAAEPDAADADPAQAEALAAAFPAWAGLIAAQARRIAAQGQAIATLSDRLTHDPFLSESVHDVLSSITAIRSAAGILRDEADLDAEWRARFHRNIYEDSRRLAESAQAMVGYLDAGASTRRGLPTPQEEAEAWFAGRGWHLPDLEGGPGDINAMLAEDGPESVSGRALVAQFLARYRDDAAALSLRDFVAAIRAVGPDPVRLAAWLGADPLMVFRRFAALPDEVMGPVGLVMCDGSGTLTFRRPVAGFDLPRYGAACPLWPLYRALSRPMQPVFQKIERVGPLPRSFDAFALARPRYPGGSTGPEVIEAAMLLIEAPGGAGGADVQPVGTSCRICARADCPARREPSLLGAGPRPT